MMDPVTNSGAGVLDPAVVSSSDQDPKKIADAARQFEALLIGELLKSAREADGENWLGTGDDQEGSTAIELAEASFARSLAAQGGIGLAGMVIDGLKQSSRPGSNAPGPASIPIGGRPDAVQDQAQPQPRPASSTSPSSL